MSLILVSVACAATAANGMIHLLPFSACRCNLWHLRRTCLHINIQGGSCPGVVEPTSDQKRSTVVQAEHAIKSQRHTLIHQPL